MFWDLSLKKCRTGTHRADGPGTSASFILTGLLCPLTGDYWWTSCIRLGLLTERRSWQVFNESKVYLSLPFGHWHCNSIHHTPYSNRESQPLCPLRNITTMWPTSRHNKASLSFLAVQRTSSNHKAPLCRQIQREDQPITNQVSCNSALNVTTTNYRLGKGMTEQKGKQREPSMETSY